MANEKQILEDNLSAVAELYSEWNSEGAKRIDSSETLEKIGELLADAGLLDDQEDSDEDDEEE